jgi:hypothetical protein
MIDYVARFRHSTIYCDWPGSPCVTNDSPPIEWTARIVVTPLETRRSDAVGIYFRHVSNGLPLEIEMVDVNDDGIQIDEQRAMH